MKPGSGEAPTQAAEADRGGRRLHDAREAAESTALIRRPVPVDTSSVGRLDDDDSFRDYNRGPPVWALVCVALGIAGAIALVVLILVD